MACEHCHNPIPANRLHCKGVKYCSKRCADNAAAIRYRLINPSKGLTSGVTGAMGELLVAADLMKRGFNVFRALAPSCPCDLAILREEKLLKVEVTTGYKTSTSKIYYNHHKTGNFDILAVVVANEIIYMPPFSDIGKGI